MKKIGLLCLVVVLALGAMGVGFATWSQTLTITEEVNTGDFCIEFGPDSPTMKDSIGPHAWTPPQYYPTNFPDRNAEYDFEGGDYSAGKNVAWGEAAYTDYQVPGPPLGCPQGLEITLYDVYPKYYNHVDFWMHNCGTIPGDLHRIYVVCNEIVHEIDIPGPDGQIVTLNLDNKGADDFQIKFGNHLGAQIEPCEEWNMSFGMVVLQDDDPDWQDNTFTFHIYYVFDQWNYEP